MKGRTQVPLSGGWPQLVAFVHREAERLGYHDENVEPAVGTSAFSVSHCPEPAPCGAIGERVPVGTLAAQEKNR